MDEIGQGNIAFGPVERRLDGASTQVGKPLPLPEAIPSVRSDVIDAEASPHVRSLVRLGLSLDEARRGVLAKGWIGCDAAGPAQVNELRDEIEAIARTEKELDALVERYGDGSYHVRSVGNRGRRCDVFQA